MGLSSKVNLSEPIVIQRLDARCLAVMRPAPQVIPRLRQGATEVAPYGGSKTKRAPVSRGPRHFRGGDDGIRTHDPHVANVMLSQLSYIPTDGAHRRNAVFCLNASRLSRPFSHFDSRITRADLLSILFLYGFAFA